MIYIKNFPIISKQDTAIAGGKGSSLGEMTQAGIPVPSGFVLITTAFKQFLVQTDLGIEIESALHEIKHDDIYSVEEVSKKICDLIHDIPFPEAFKQEILTEFDNLNSPFVAVRSSATVEDSAIASWAGELESYLNITRATLLESIKKCWSSLFTPRAIFYRFNKNLQDSKISVAVVVQAMIQSEISGICFTAHPVTEDLNQIVIEAGFGLGEAIVGGMITPDTYIIHKNSWKILDKNINKQRLKIVRDERGGNREQSLPNDKQGAQKLSDDQILDLAHLCQKIEEHYACPQDIEWALADGKFFIVQSRPITTLGVRISEQKISPSSFARHSLLYRQSDIPVVFTDIILSPECYGTFDGFLLQESDTLAHFLSQRGFESMYQLGMSLLDDKVAESVLQKSKDFIERIKNTEKLQINFLSDNPVIILRVWKTITDILHTLCVWYRYSDWPTLKVLEDALMQEGCDQDTLIEILVDPSKVRERGLSDRAYKIAMLMKELGEIRFTMHESIGTWFELFSKCIESTGRMIGATRQEAFMMRKREIEEVLSGSSFVVSILHERLGGCIFLPPAHNIKIWQCLTGDPYLQMKALVERSHSGGVIRGTSASKGIARGKVVVQKGWVSTSRILSGSVLVCGMTSPNMVPLLKNVIAIVTDEGGLTSHAAIISRELKIPCIIGTSNATQVLKDGDEVEVNADSGVVRILKNEK